MKILPLLLVALFLLSSCAIKEQQIRGVEPRLDNVSLIVGGSNLSCVTAIEDRVTRGESLAGIIEPGTVVRIYYGYYNCNRVERGDIVAYNFSGNPDPLIKVVKGIPNDSFALVQEEDVHRLLINGKVAMNSEGDPYNLDPTMLSLYVRDYGGRIPQDTLLLLGNTDDSLDSRRFGLVGMEGVLGIAVPLNSTTTPKEYAGLAGAKWAFRSSQCTASDSGCSVTATCPAGTTIQGFRSGTCSAGAYYALGNINNQGGCSLDGTSCTASTGYGCGGNPYNYVAIVCN